MCGIAGYWDPRRKYPLDATVRAMNGQLRHRGPDADGVWIDEEAGVALGHTRLAIIDVSDAGAQPMVSACGRYVIIYNGEIYNAQDLRSELPGIAWRGHSDTEVLLAACAAWGVEKAVSRSVGMFAFALWDRHDRVLTLARDRLGVKPVYWGEFGPALVFASELKAIRAFPEFTGEIDRKALARYLRFNHVPAPASIFAKVRKLEPGTILVRRAGGATEISRFWDLREIAGTGQENPRDIGDAEAIREADRLLRDAVGRRMVSDVPLGAFLSGGIDSSVVASFMQAQSDRPVKTFAIGFREQGFDEAPHAAEVARHLGTDHTELYVTPEQARDVIPQLPQWYDEPFADSSQIPTLLVSAMTRRHVTVALSGDGGDEVFAGYDRYVLGQRVARFRRCLPSAAKSAVAAACRALSPDAWNRLLSVLPSGRLPSHPGEKLHKLARIIDVPSDMEMYERLVSAWDGPVPSAGDNDPVRDAAADHGLDHRLPFLERMLLSDSLHGLPDDMLTKVDRASMSVGLEVRVPLLDHRLVEFAWTLPSHMKIRENQGKWLLRQVLKSYVPERLTDRPKMGFSLPLGNWLRGPLRSWAESHLSMDALMDDGLLNPALIRDTWDRHLAGTRDETSALWTVLMFQSWRRHWRASSGA